MGVRCVLHLWLSPGEQICVFSAAAVCCVRAAGGKQPEHDPDRGPVCHAAQLSGCCSLLGNQHRERWVSLCLGGVAAAAGGLLGCRAGQGSASNREVLGGHLAQAVDRGGQSGDPTVNVCAWSPVALTGSLSPPICKCTAGLFYFDASYRPVPLEMQFVGVSERNVMARMNVMDEICYQKVAESLKRGFQAMVFVHRCGMQMV